MFAGSLDNQSAAFLTFQLSMEILVFWEFTEIYKGKLVWFDQQYERLFQQVQKVAMIPTGFRLIYTTIALSSPFASFCNYFKNKTDKQDKKYYSIKTIITSPLQNETIHYHIIVALSRNCFYEDSKSFTLSSDGEMQVSMRA